MIQDDFQQDDLISIEQRLSDLGSNIGAMDKDKAEKCHVVIRSMKDTQNDQEKFFGEMLQERERYICILQFSVQVQKNLCLCQPCLTQ